LLKNHKKQGSYAIDKIVITIFYYNKSNLKNGMLFSAILLMIAYLIKMLVMKIFRFFSFTFGWKNFFNSYFRS
jgi:hypothetical protein